MTSGKYFTIKAARFVPVGLCIAAILAGIFVSPWWFLSVPFVLLGSTFTAPNLNLVNGLPSYIAILVGFILYKIHPPSGSAILLGVVAGFYGSALEMRLLAKSAPLKK